MTFKRISEFGLSLVLSLSSLLMIAVPKAHAATVTWDGEGSDNNFSTAANWSGDTVPSNGDLLIFPTSVDSDTLNDDDRELNNDLIGLSVAGIQVTGTYVSGDYDTYEISGNALTLSGNITGADTFLDTYMLIHADVAFSTNATVQSVLFFGDVNNGSNTLTLLDSSSEGSYTSAGGAVIFGGSGISGGAGGGCLYPTTDTSPSFNGTVTVNNQGRLRATSNLQGIFHNASSITLNSGGTLFATNPFNQDLSIATPLTLNGGDFFAYQNSDFGNGCAGPTTTKQLTLNGNVTLTADTTFYLGSVDLKFTGTVTGKNHIKLEFTSKGKVIFSDGSTIEPQHKTTEYTANNSGLSIYVSNNETAIVTGAYGNASVGEGGVLKGTGTVGTLSVFAGGKVAPGLSPGCLNSGNFTLGGTFEVEIGGTTVCTEYDQQRVTGTVNLTDGTLSVLKFNNFVPKAGNVFQIIDNDSNDAVTGTFNGLAEGATLTVEGVVYRVSYVGGDGNDVTLTVVSVPAIPDTGFQLLTNNPVMTFISTLLAAGTILMIAKKYQTVSIGK